ncbi:MAG: excinuclease ABC subunit UvrC [Lentisphaeria bacterium]|nr:excinuclease ABC subunit UvrC [Lentisphaeria bacterium]
MVYVGKAKSLRKRLSSYFQPSRKHRADPKLRALINSIAAYETLVVKNEAEALLLESRLVKEYHPRYNIELRDDKQFLHVCIDPNEPYPRLRLVRQQKSDGRLYFGPFPRAGSLRNTVDFLSKRFSLRTCSPRKPCEETFMHCLEHIIRSCLCPCVKQVSPEEYASQVAKVINVLEGNTREILDELSARMLELAERREYEQAARTRDTIENIRSACERKRAFSRTTLGLPGSCRKDAVAALQRELGMEKPPVRIECFDMSNLAGTLAVGSMVCFVDGASCKKEYRRFRIQNPEAKDDTAMMREVLGRRYSRLLEKGGGEGTPDLIVVDGGIGQLHAALRALAETGMEPTALLGLAKKQEEIFLPGRSEPLCLEKSSPALRLLQAVRDEAHRFAVSYNRTLRRRRIRESVLAEIAGVGPARQCALLREFGSVQKLAKAGPMEIRKRVEGIGLALAELIHNSLNTGTKI